MLTSIVASARPRAEAQVRLLRGLTAGVQVLA
jgi:hypothetical protein